MGVAQRVSARRNPETKIKKRLPHTAYAYRTDNWKVTGDRMAAFGGSELLESIVHQLIDEEMLGVAFEMHRAIKLGYYELLYPDDR